MRNYFVLLNKDSYEIANIGNTETIDEKTSTEDFIALTILRRKPVLDLPLQRKLRMPCTGRYSIKSVNWKFMSLC